MMKIIQQGMRNELSHITGGEHKITIVHIRKQHKNLYKLKVELKKY